LGRRERPADGYDFRIAGTGYHVSFDRDGNVVSTRMNP